MPGYATREIRPTIGGHEYRLRVLADTQQYADPDGHGERLGVSSAQWSLFGQLWPSGEMLAHLVETVPVEGRRVLELGCGIGLASLVLGRRGADVVASDVHPLAEVFLAYNAALNDLPALNYRQVLWDQPMPALGKFDLIVASDVLYERGQAEVISAFVARHANPCCEVIVTDPGRGNSARFGRLMVAQGFDAATAPWPTIDPVAPPPRSQYLRCVRGRTLPRLRTPTALSSA